MAVKGKNIILRIFLSPLCIRSGLAKRPYELLRDQASVKLNRGISAMFKQDSPYLCIVVGRGLMKGRPPVTGLDFGIGPL